MTEWTYADIWQSIARAQPQATAFVQGERTVSWEEFELTGDALAQYLLDSGLGRQSKVGAYLYNCPEYLCTVAAALKVAMVPFNVNYRYGSEELLYLLDNADAEALIFDRAFIDRLAPIRSRLPKIKRWIAVGGGPADSSDWIVSYEEIVRHSPPRPYRVIGVAVATISCSSTPAARLACPKASCGGKAICSAWRAAHIRSSV